jgi:hypothetical protein
LHCKYNPNSIATEEREAISRPLTPSIHEWICPCQTAIEAAIEVAIETAIEAAKSRRALFLKQEAGTREGGSATPASGYPIHQ